MPEAATRPPREALAFWRAKVPLGAAEFQALSDQARQRAFAVSGLARRDQVELVHAALTEALEQGLPLAAFKKKLAPLLEQKGWTGQKAWRVENIYRTNLQTAYQAGRYAQLQATVKGRPFWRYLAVKDSRTRPAHLALHGRVFPHDHEFWRTWYPPNGFMCRCTVQSLSQRQVDARGLEVETRLPRLAEPLDPVSGRRLPAIPIAPDPGWAGNVGRDWLSGLAPRELEGGYRAVATQAVCRDGRGVFSVGGICKPPLDKLDTRHILRFSQKDILPKGLKEEEYVRAFLGEFGLKGLDEAKVHTLPGGIPVVISAELFQDRQTRQWKASRGGRGPYMRLLARTILSPYEIWHGQVQSSGGVGGVRDTLRLIRLFAGQEDQVGGFVVFDLIGGRRWRGTTIFTPGVNKATQAARERYLFNNLWKERSGVLLYREP